MNVSKISLNKLLDEILSKKISILGDSHLDENWVYNQRIIVSKLLNKNVLFGLECPTELLAFSPLTDLIPANRRVPLVNSSETEEKEYNRDITKSLITYASFFDNSIPTKAGPFSRLFFFTYSNKVMSSLGPNTSSKYLRSAPGLCGNSIIK